MISRNKIIIGLINGLILLSYFLIPNFYMRSNLLLENGVDILAYKILGPSLYIYGVFHWIMPSPGALACQILLILTLWLLTTKLIFIIFNLKKSSKK